MRVTLIQPRYFNIWEALGLAYIGAHVKRHFQGALDLRFFQGYFDDDSVIIDGAADSDVVGFSCTSPSFAHALRLARELKRRNPSVRTVAGGFHPSAVPHECLADAIDQVVVGEGEDAFLRILNGENASVVFGRPYEEFGTIFPDRDLICNRRAVDLCEQQIGRRITSFQSIRVCPFRCTFCAERIVTGTFNRVSNPLRERSPEHLVEEISKTARDLDLDYFKFADATWNTSTEKVIAFCEELLRRGVRLPWEANVHASYANLEMLRMMKRAGCHQMNVGCESGSQRILNDMKKGLSVAKIRQTFEWAREVGIERRAYFLLGMPNETREDVQKTEELVEEIHPEVFGITILCPYPGTDHYNPVTMRDYDWESCDEYSNPYWSTPHFTNAELHAVQARLTEKFSEQLAWHNRILRENAQASGSCPS
jgi:radical SAM superfamily enzyme YgiQ (UPF0313 family)